MSIYQQKTLCIDYTQNGSSKQPVQNINQNMKDVAINRKNMS